VFLFIQAGDALIQLYNHFISDFETKINLLKFAHFTVVVSRQYLDKDAGINYLEGIISKLRDTRESRVEEPILYVKMQIATFLLFSKTVKPNFITREQRNYKSSITVTTQPPKRNRHADSHIGMNTEGSNQRVNLTDEPLLAQNKNSKNRSSQPADTKSPISLNLLHARWQNILPAHRLRSVL
jgi:hypothetical protein